MRLFVWGVVNKTLKFRLTFLILSSLWTGLWLSRELTSLSSGFFFPKQRACSQPNIVMLTINSRSPWEIILGFKLTVYSWQLIWNPRRTVFFVPGKESPSIFSKFNTLNTDTPLTNNLTDTFSGHLSGHVHINGVWLYSWQSKSALNPLNNWYRRVGNDVIRNVK